MVKETQCKGSSLKFHVRMSHESSLVPCAESCDLSCDHDSIAGVCVEGGEGQVM